MSRWKGILCAVVLLWICQPWCSISAAQVDQAAAVAAAHGIANQVSAQEWLGPLSAIALSPFFGLACLSGVSTYGPEWLQNRSTLLAPTSPLNNPLFFWTMAALTVVTSLPRFTKVSKPLALAAEKLEAYSAIIILIAMKWIASSPGQPMEAAASLGQPVLVAGIATLPMDLLLSVAVFINIIVVNTIKLAIELLVWLIPIPTIDAFLEVANKSICAAMIGLYAYSPMLATMLNLFILMVCGLVFFRVHRKLVYYRTIILYPLLARVMGTKPSNKDSFQAFLSHPWNSNPKDSRWTVTTSDWVTCSLMRRAWTKTIQLQGTIQLSQAKPGLLADQVDIVVGHSTLRLNVPKGTLPMESATQLVAT